MRIYKNYDTQNSIFSFKETKNNMLVFQNILSISYLVFHLWSLCFRKQTWRSIYGIQECSSTVGTEMNLKKEKTF